MLSLFVRYDTFQGTVHRSRSRKYGVRYKVAPQWKRTISRYRNIVLKCFEEKKNAERKESNRDTPPLETEGAVNWVGCEHRLSEQDRACPPPGPGFTDRYKFTHAHHGKHTSIPGNSHLSYCTAIMTHRNQS